MTTAVTSKITAGASTLQLTERKGLVATYAKRTSTQLVIAMSFQAKLKERNWIFSIVIVCVSVAQNTVALPKTARAK